MGNHNLHKIGLTFLGEEEEEAIRLRDPETTGGKQQILPRPGSNWEKDERKWAESKPGGRLPMFRKQQLLQSCRKTKMTSGPPHLRLCWVMYGKSVSECPNPTSKFSLTQAHPRQSRASIQVHPEKSLSTHRYLSHFSPIPEERKAGAAKLPQAQGVVPDNNVSHSAYLVFMSADACLMECSFSLCVRFLILW